MLRGIHPLLGPDLLHALRSLGHGDEVVIADANFPSHTLGPRVVRLDGIDALVAADAILTHLPLDTFAEAAVFRMAVVGDPEADGTTRSQADGVVGDRLYGVMQGPGEQVSRPGVWTLRPS